MSIFKTISTKIKRVVSLKNLTNAVTGNFTAIGKDAVRVMTTKSPAEIKNDLASTEGVVQPFSIPQEVSTIISAKEKQYKTAVSTALAENINVQNVSDMFTQTYLKSMWIKYKNLVIGLLLTSVAIFIGWKFLKKPSVKRARARR